MHKVIISDTSCLILLDKISELSLLQKVYGEIYTTIEVAIEYGLPLPGWILILPVKDKNVQQVLELQIDTGEASAIALSLETKGSIVIIDDYKARKVAERLGLDITGTIGVIVKAKLKGVIPSIIPYLEKIRKTDFRLSDEVEMQALKLAGE